MDGAPYGPWRLTPTGAPPEPPGPLDGTTFAMDAALYEAAARLGIAPADLDRCEIWQVAAALGINDVPDAGPVSEMAGVREREPRRPAPKPQAPTAAGATIAARMRHAAGEGPKPEAAPATGMATVMRRVAEVEAQPEGGRLV